MYFLSLLQGFFIVHTQPKEKPLYFFKMRAEIVIVFSLLKVKSLFSPLRNS